MAAPCCTRDDASYTPCTGRLPPDGAATSLPIQGLCPCKHRSRSPRTDPALPSLPLSLPSFSTSAAHAHLCCVTSSAPPSTRTPLRPSPHRCYSLRPPPPLSSPCLPCCSSMEGQQHGRKGIACGCKLVSILPASSCRSPARPGLPPATVSRPAGEAVRRSFPCMTSSVLTAGAAAASVAPAQLPGAAQA